MKVIYKSICDEIIDLNCAAMASNRTIKKIILNKAEALQLKEEINCHNIWSGTIGMIDGIPLEVK